jgi:PPOX class probable F420-dependent enzyme
MIAPLEKFFLNAGRVGHLATADRAGRPHVVPVCYAVTETAAYITIDGKPKHADIARMKRLRNIVENPAVALVVDRYDEDWSRLGWVMLRGAAEILPGGPEHDQAQALLCERYKQLRAMDIANLPVIAMRIARVTSWGALTV